MRHVKEEHYYDTRNKNSYSFESSDKVKIYHLASSYYRELMKIVSDPSYSGEESAKKLLPQLRGKEIPPRDLERIVAAQRSFAKRFLSHNLSSCDWDMAMTDLVLFFNQGLPYYDSNFCPTLLIDFLWHSMMQDSDLYERICQHIFYETMPHCNIERSAEEDAARYEYFRQVFVKRNNREPYCPWEQNSEDCFSKILPCFGLESGIPGQQNNVSEVLLSFAEAEIQKENELRLKKQQEHERMMEKRRQRELKEEETMQIISLDVGIPRENISSGLVSYYIEGYNKGIRGKSLTRYVDSELAGYYSRSGSTC